MLALQEFGITDPSWYVNVAPTSAQVVTFTAGSFICFSEHVF